MNGPCFNGGPNCGKLDCAWGCAGSVKLTVPTGGVPRVGGYEEAVVRMKTIADLSTQIRGAPADDPIQRAVDDYLLMERKARAWDELVERARDWASVEVTLEELERAVHPAQPSAPAKG